MPRYNIFIPDYLVEQWEELENKSRWVQEKLDEEYEEQKEKKKVAENAQSN